MMTNPRPLSTVTPKVLIVIPCLDEVAYIEKIVQFCYHEQPPEHAKIVVADGGSQDGTLTILTKLAHRYSNLVILYNPKKIQSSGVNLAVEMFGHDFDVFVRIDVHADYSTGYIKALVEEKHKMQADAVVVSMDTQGKSPLQRLIAATQNSALGNGGSGHRNSLSKGEWVEHGHHALMSTAIFTQVKGYDESFSHNEDAELDARIIKQGGKIWLTAKTSLTYYPRDRFSTLFKQYKGYGSGRCKTLFKHRLKPKLRQTLPVIVFPALLLTGLAPVTPFALIPALTWAVLCLLVGALLGKRSSLKGAMKFLLGVPAMVMHLGWSLGFCQQLIRQIFSKKNRHSTQALTHES
ncbi:glycosyltransferase family 2 protein [Vibrio sp. FNV 38]|nr:glycosyltransferase family 2 protein [Vibrio sp. FNV 38]